jgi:NADH-quinone oxidoreductase subunit A
METAATLPVFLMVAAVLGLAALLLGLAAVLNPKRPGAVMRMPYESGMDPIHDTRRRFDVRFHLVAIAFLVFDVELLFLYPWAVAMHGGNAATAGTMTHPSPPTPLPHEERGAMQPNDITAAVRAGWAGSRDLVFVGAMIFFGLMGLGFLYDWRKGVFRWK